MGFLRQFFLHLLLQIDRVLLSRSQNEFFINAKVMPNSLGMINLPK